MTSHSAGPLIDIISHGRKVADPRHPLNAFQVEQIRRTVNRTPEVMIKVTGGAGANDARGIAAHFSYIGRRGEVDIETDDGDLLRNRDAGKQLLDAWDLDIDLHRRRSELFAVNHRKPPKLVHRLVYSMPAGTPSKKVLAAVREFAREEFGLKYRYAMALHTDDPHPHVHVVVKAVSEEGVRLNIRKDTLRRWRHEFAKQLRFQGVAANATTRAVRGHSNTRKSDGIYRAARRGASTHMRRKITEAAHALKMESGEAEPAKAQLLNTRAAVHGGWLVATKLLDVRGEIELARAVRRYVANLPPVKTEREQLVDQLRGHTGMPRSRASTRDDA
jgi:type IV secretory pathway VirD2 relaxase